MKVDSDRLSLICVKNLCTISAFRFRLLTLSILHKSTDSPFVRDSITFDDPHSKARYDSFPLPFCRTFHLTNSKAASASSFAECPIVGSESCMNYSQSLLSISSTTSRTPFERERKEGDVTFLRISFVNVLKAYLQVPPFGCGNNYTPSHISARSRQPIPKEIEELTIAVSITFRCTILNALKSFSTPCPTTTVSFPIHLFTNSPLTSSRSFSPLSRSSKVIPENRVLRSITWIPFEGLTCTSYNTCPASLSTVKRARDIPEVV